MPVQSYAVILVILYSSVTGAVEKPPILDLAAACDVMHRANSASGDYGENVSYYLFEKGALKLQVTEPDAAKQILQREYIQVLSNRFDHQFNAIVAPHFAFVNTDPLYSRPYTQTTFAPVVIDSTLHFVNTNPLVSRIRDNTFAFQRLVGSVDGKDQTGDVPNLSSESQSFQRTASSLSIRDLAKQVVKRDEDVVAAKSALSARPSDQTDGASEYKANLSTFLAVHYHLGRIDVHRAVSRKAGRCDEKEALLLEATQRWAASIDTHSTTAPKPSMETILALEPSEERFARILADTYRTEITGIREQLKDLYQRIAIDSERMGPPGEREDRMVALLREAQEQEDKGRTSLGGEARMDEFGKILSRTLVPALMQLGRRTTVTDPTDAAAKLAAAVSEAFERAAEGYPEQAGSMPR